MPHTLFVIDLDYKTPLEEVDRHIPAHIEFLDASYARGIFLASGPKTPRTGGVIIAHNTSRSALLEWIEQDPFFVHDIATYSISEFSAVKQDPRFLSGDA